MHLYLATDLRPAAEDGRLGPDEDERLLVERVPWRDALADAERGEIVDAKSLVGLFWLARLRGEPAIGAGGAAGRSTVGRRADAPGAAVGGRPRRGDLPADRSTSSRWRSVTVARRSRVLHDPGARRGWPSAALSWFNGAVVFGIVCVLLGVVFGTGVLRLPRGVAAGPSATGPVRGLAHLHGRRERHHPSPRRSAGPPRTGRPSAVPWSPAASCSSTPAPATTCFVPVRAFTPSELGVLYRLLDRAGLFKGGTP